MVSASADVGEGAPGVHVVRRSFFPLPGGERSGNLRWIESSPIESSDPASSHDAGYSHDVLERPDVEPFDVRQEVRLSWPSCSIVVEQGICEPWVTFRAAGDVDEWRRRRRVHDVRDDEDRDYAHFIFDARQRSMKVEIASERIPVTGVLLTNLLVGNQIDTGRLLDRWGQSTSVVDLAGVSTDQVWLLHAYPWLDATRTIHSPEEAAALRRVLNLARDVRESALPHATSLDVDVDEVRARAEADSSLLRAAGELRRALAPFYFRVEETEMLRLACEMYTQEMQQASRSSTPSRRRPPSGRLR